MRPLKHVGDLGHFCYALTTAFPQGMPTAMRAERVAAYVQSFHPTTQSPVLTANQVMPLASKLDEYLPSTSV